jgi:hypothetical protein
MEKAGPYKDAAGIYLWLRLCMSACQGLIQCDTGTVESFQPVIEKTVFAATLESNNGKTVLANLVERYFLPGAFNAYPITNGNLQLVDHLYSPIYEVSWFWVTNS